MFKKVSKQCLSVFLAIAMALSMLSPVTVLAADVSAAEGEAVPTAEVGSENSETEDDASDIENPSDGEDEGSDTEDDEEAVPGDASDDSEGPNAPVDENDEEQEDVPEDEGGEGDGAEDIDSATQVEIAPAATYAEFLDSLKALEGYAASYAAQTNDDAVGLVINYIRTGISKYNTDSWAILAGAENIGFAAFVCEQDAANGTRAQALKGIDTFTIPSGQTVEFTHMFGALNIAYYNNYAQMSSDFGGWAGDLCDLMEYSMNKAVGDTVDAMTDDIRENYLGIDDEKAHSFGYLDICGDLDAYYLMTRLAEKNSSLSAVMEQYFTENLNDEARATFFLKNRFPGKATKADVREAVYSAYKSNSGAIMLEADRGMSSKDDLRHASCYAFADYLYELAKENLEPETPVDPSEPEEPEKPADNPYYSVFSSSTQNLAPGVKQEIKYAVTADDKQIVYYIATVDVNRDDLTICANYNNNDGSSWAMSRVSDQMAAAQAKHTNPEDPEHYIENYNAILGVNGDFFNMTTGAPSGALVMEGVEYNGVASENFFGILKDGTPVMGGSSLYKEVKNDLQEAVGVNMYLVRDGKIAVTPSSNYYKDRAPRTCVGITADGQVVLMVLDGRQEPFSTGGSAIEIAQIMLEAGCVVAGNLDGGGSTTFAAKEEGADRVTVVNRPSDGYERSVSSSLMVVSTAKMSNEFDHALIETETDYLTPGTSFSVNVTGVSSSGNAAEIPENAVLRVSDETRGTLEGEIFTAVKRGDVTIEMVVDGVVVGSKVLHIVIPNGVAFEKKSLNAIYGVDVPLPISATYNGNPVSINADDVTFTLSSPAAGAINDFVFVGDEASGVKVVTITADLTLGIADSVSINVSLFNNGEAIFDFEDATAGDESLAWNREVTNTMTDDEKVYYITDPEQSVDVSYVFALDMREIKIPERLKDMVALLPGGDSPDASAWGFLLQLAERVSVLTEVDIQMQIDPDMDVDYSELKFVNEYFHISSAELDEETNTLHVKVNWINQTQAIDPDTADPVCILSGIKLTPKADAAWSSDGRLDVAVNGTLSYDIYLRASTLYGVASDPGIQAAYGIYPFVNPYDPNEKGGHFGTNYAQFEDSFLLDRNPRQGWIVDDDRAFYYVDNVAVTGIQYLPENGHEENLCYFTFDENGVCLGKVTGLFEMGGDLYYAINGKPFTGWRLITTDSEDQYYFFDPATGKAVDGEQTIYGYHYTFTDCVLTHGDLVKNETGIHYKWAGEWVTNSWVEIDGKKYCAGRAPYGYFITSLGTHIYKYGSDTEMAYGLFGEDGAWQEGYSGLYTDAAQNTYLIDDGYLVEGGGLAYVDGYYYYFRTSTGAAVKNRSYWITITNGLPVPEGTYTFDESGRMVNPPQVTPVDPDPEEPEQPEEPQVKNGIVAENGSLYYYVDGVITPAGLIKIDGDYYYVRTSNGEVVHGRSYWVTKTNDLPVPSGNYAFDESGKMIDPPAEDAGIKDGIVEENGSLYYYVNGVLTYAGLIQIDGDYYYVRTSSGEVIHGRSYWVAATNGLPVPEGTYTFDESGKMVNPPVVGDEAKNGIVAENGSLFYYVDGKITPAGLIEIDGDYYYARTSNGEVVHGRSYWVTKTNGLPVAEGSYTFADDGKMIR